MPAPYFLLLFELLDYFFDGHAGRFNRGGDLLLRCANKFDLRVNRYLKCGVSLSHTLSPS